MKNEEHQIQAGIVEAVSYLPECEWLHAIPNGGKRNIVTAVKLKKEGVKPGIADLFLPIPMEHKGKIYHGLYVEVKVANRGRLSKDQKRFAAHCVKYDYFFLKLNLSKKASTLFFGTCKD